MFESVDARTDAQAHARTLARVPSYKLTLWAFGSGELKTCLEYESKQSFISDFSEYSRWSQRTKNEI